MAFFLLAFNTRWRFSKVFSQFLPSGLVSLLSTASFGWVVQDQTYAGKTRQPLLLQMAKDTAGIRLSLQANGVGG